MPGQHEARNAPGERFSGRAIQLEVLAEALQHPATLYPFAACALAASYGLFVAPFVGGQPWALLAAAATGLASAASFTWHYFVQGESYARDKARRVVESEARRREDVEKNQLQALRSELERQLRESGAAEALEVLNDLATEYDGLDTALKRQDGVDPLSLARMEVSAAEAYRRGLDMLGEAGDLFSAIHSTDRKSLTAEVKELEAEIAQLTKRGTQPDRVSLKQQSLEAHTRTLELIEKQAINAERLMHRAEIVEAALRQARVTLPSLDWGGTNPAAQEVVAVLEEPAGDAPSALRRSGQREAIPERYEAREVR